MNSLERQSIFADVASYEPALSIPLIIGSILYSIILHEMAHGYVAEKLGDPTARKAGRITLNPLSHIDPFFTFALPIMTGLSTGVLSYGVTSVILDHPIAIPVLIGGPAPVPVDFNNLKYGEWGAALVAFAGPAVNISLFAAASLLLQTGLYTDSLEPALQVTKNINFWLAAFNLLPIPPLDGSHIARAVLSSLSPKQQVNAYP